MIEVRALTVDFGRTRALERVDLTIGEGVTGLFGPNASGKSTLLRVLAGLLRPSAGTVTIDGVAPARAPEALRRTLGYAGHRSGLYPRLTVAENLRLYARLYDLAEDSVAWALAAVDLERRAATPVAELSAGLRRRAAIARAVLHRPRWLLLDEPYANLDEDAAAAVSQAVAAWNEPGRGALIASHGAKKVKAFARAGVILRDGRVVKEGSYVAASEARA